MFFLKKNKDTTNSSYKYELPFSKQTVEFARVESYIVAILLFVFGWFDKDVSSLIILGTLFIGGYRLVQSSYLKMARQEHLMEMKLKAKELGIDDEFIDEEMEQIDQEFDEELNTVCNENMG